MSTPQSRREFLAAGAAALGASVVPRRARAAASIDRLGIDYAYYNPPSLILKEFGWIESALPGTKIDWVLSLGSNKGNQFVASRTVAFGSTAGSAAFLARANGTPLHSVYLYSQPEWTALVVGKNSKITAVGELKGKTIAATRGTDPWFFLLRSLRDAGLAPNDVNIVELQHPDGRIALERGQVDAWAGLDPHMAASQLQAGSRLLYRNRAYNTYGSLNSHEAFLREHPDVAALVLTQYERARQFAIHNQQKTIEILAKYSSVPIEVATLQIRERTRYPDPIPGAPFIRAVGVCESIIRDDKLVAAGTDLDAALRSLVDPSSARIALHHA